MKNFRFNLNTVVKFFTAAAIFFFLLQGCGKKNSTTTDDKKSDSQSDSKTDIKDILSLDKPVYVEFSITGDINGTIKAYYKNKKYKSENIMKVGAGEMTSTMYSDGTNIYTVTDMAGTKTGMKMDATKFNDPENKNNNLDISSFKERIKDYTKIGEEDIVGKHCDIYQSNKNPDMKMSVYQDLIPLKIQTKKMTMVATKLDKDVNVNDDVFTPPSDVKYIDMGNMMQDLKNPDKLKDSKEQLKQLEENMKNYKK